MTIWTWQNWQMCRHEVKRPGQSTPDAVITCYGWLWRIDIAERSLVVEVILAGLGINR